MKPKISRRGILLTAAATSAALLLGACGQDEAATGAAGGGTTKLKVALDWTPNTNHTGLYVAQAKGFFAKHGLDVEIVQPGDADASALLAADKVQFAISAQESLTQARAQDVPIVSVAAVVQHNTSGFASPKGKNITKPSQYAGKTYGGYGGPVEEALLRTLVAADGGDPAAVKVVNVGNADFFTATKKDIDFEWIFYGWTGVEAELRNEPVNIQYVKDYDKALDFYTPVLATSEKQISQNPDTVKAFLAATSEGYNYAADNAEESAGILLGAAPDLDKELVNKSQAWLGPKYRDDAPRWGEQSPEVWTSFTDWLFEHKVITKKIDPSKAYTNDFLPAGNG
ncbi:ABC transporter substrate-binding protein [Paractinoplanes lichenicola]|uniref:ABC transporter substrate-binding protein n=1 Tax=Paractinoplanes lichenicola TaxID=2802976 RepID=A0ABS1VEN8_9ACTN|nr:ABC transporter substrate-binding protein [Actinoplanes lichenicola]MBL7253144.1 ABC transporter substrate-binding protein [Actinoplanes lichenicola]